MISKKIPDLSAFRYERKFRVTQATLADVENIVRLHPAGFSQAYPERNVNNIYFDTINLQTFVDNIDGLANRTKFRIRWYGKLFGVVENPILEHKLKRNLAGTKNYFPVQSFILEPGITNRQLYTAIENSNMPEDCKLQIRQMSPLLLNRYNRKYYVSTDGQYRLTLDYDLYYYRIREMNNTFLQHYVDRRTIVIELKYAVEQDNEAHRISSYFPFRMTKNSKYVTGVQGLYS